MYRILVLIFILSSAFGVSESFGQINRKNIKKNNRKISNFKGKKTKFSSANKYNAVGVTLNAMNYYGDIAPLPKRISTDLGFTRPAFGVSFTHRFGPFYQVTGGFSYGTLAGSDAESADPNNINSAYRYVRNLSFRNRIKELSIVGEVDLFPNYGTYISRVAWTPYAYAGLAFFHHNPQAKNKDGEWVKLQPLGTEGQHADLPESAANHGIKPYKLLQIAIPFGVGIRYRINELLDISGEFGFRFLFTDYIDDVSRNYVDLSELDSDQARELSYRSWEINPNVSEQVATIIANKHPLLIGPDGQPLVNGYGYEFPQNVRGNKSDRDMYTVTTIRLTYILGKTFHKAKFR